MGIAGVGAGIAVAGAVVAGIKMVTDLNAQAYENELQAEEDRRNAKLAKAAQEDAFARGNVDSSQPRMESAQLAGRVRTAYANSGVDASVGTAADVAAYASYMGEYEALTIQNNAAREAWGYAQTGEKLARQQSYGRHRAGAQQAGTILGGASDLAASAAGVAGAFAKAGY